MPRELITAFPNSTANSVQTLPRILGLWRQRRGAMDVRPPQRTTL
jgi:hypothetical protein